jgi:3'-5' exoribonuclease
MKKQTVSFFDAAGIAVDSVFAVQKIAFKDSRNGTQFLACELADATGSLNAVMWQVPEPVRRDLKNGGVARVKGKSNIYQDTLQVVIDDLQMLAPGEYQASDFLPVSPRDRKEMEQELRTYIGQIRDPGMAKFVAGWILEPAFLARFMTAPAAKTIHHATLGGLPEHSLETLKFGLKMADAYPEADKDFVIAGSLLHDMGKLRDYACSTVIEMTDEGRLLNHIGIGYGMFVEEVVKASVKEAAWVTPLGHIILSHHGTREMGSPVEPATIEAMIVHLSDLASGRLNQMSQVLSTSDPNNAGWSAYDRFLKTSLFKGLKPPAEP